MMFSMTQKKRKTVPATGEVTFEVGETAAAGAAAAAQNNPSQTHAPTQVKLLVGSAGVTGAGNTIQQKALMGFGSFSNLANLFHTAAQQRALVAFHGAAQPRSPLGIGTFSSRANLYQPAPPASFAGMNSGGNYFHGSTSTETPCPLTPLSLHSGVVNHSTPKKIPVPFESANGVANLVHENPFVQAPRGFVGIDGIGYVFHKITQQRTPVHYTIDGVKTGGGSDSRPQSTRRGRVVLTMSNDSYWDDGLTQLFRAIEVAPRSANLDQGYFFLGERCLVCFKKFMPSDDIYLYMGEYAYCSPPCRDLHISFEVSREKFSKQIAKEKAPEESAEKEGSVPATKKKP